MVKITEVDIGSLAARRGILAGDTLISINGNEITDVLDYRFYLAENSSVPRRQRSVTELSAR